MAIVAMIILGVLIFLFTGQEPLFRRRVPLYTYLRHSAALSAGAPVRLNGILIGNVRKVELSGSNDPARVVRVELSVEQSRLRAIPVDSVAGLGAETVLATKYIDIRKGQSTTTIPAGGELKSEDTGEFEDLVKKGFNVMDSLQATINRVDRIVNQVELGKGSIGKFFVDDEFYTRLVATVTEMQRVSEAVSSGKGTLGRLLYDESLYNRVLASVDRLEAVIQDVQQGQGTAGKLLRDPALYDEARATIAQFRRLVDDLNAGKGTAGKLLKDETAYRQIQSLLTKIENTIDRVNTGQGTLGQLVVNPQLYESLTGATTELRSLIKDIRANPKKFLRIKLGLF
jgi:phospholipid/cholesterol/gamma-HCH transport system substrate-binding protein